MSPPHPFAGKPQAVHSDTLEALGGAADAAASAAEATAGAPRGLASLMRQTDAPVTHRAGAPRGLPSKAARGVPSKAARGVAAAAKRLFPGGEGRGGEEEEGLVGTPTHSGGKVGAGGEHTRAFPTASPEGAPLEELEHAPAALL